MIKKLALLLGCCLLFAGARGQNITTNPMVVAAPTCSFAAKQNVPISCQITPTGGVPPYSYTLVFGGGSGMSVSQGSGGGLINGTPTGTAAVVFSMTVADSGNTAVPLVFTITPASLVSIALTPAAPVVQASGTVQLTATGTWSDNSTDNLSTLASWGCSGTGCSSVSSTGLFTASGSAGTPTATATFNSISNPTYHVTVTAGTVPPTFTTLTPPNGQINQPYPENTSSGYQLACTGGSGGPYTFALGSMVLPSGMSLSSSGLISGTPTASGTQSGTFTCTSSSNTGTSPSMSIIVASLSTVTITPTGQTILPSSTLQMTATGTYSDASTLKLNGLSGNTWSCSSGSGCGTVSGGGLFTASATNNSTATIQDVFGSVTGTTTVAVQSVTITTTTPLCNANINIPFPTVGQTGCPLAGQGQQFAATSGSPPYTWTLSSGTLIGLNLTSAGVLNGSPTSACTANPVIEVTDNASHTNTGTFSLTSYHTVTVTWTAGAAVAPATLAGYNIYRSTTSGGPYTQLNTALITGLSYVDTTAAFNTTYYYVVTTQDSTGANSANSTQGTGTVPAISTCSSGSAPVTLVQFAGQACFGSQACAAPAYTNNTTAGDSEIACVVWTSSTTGITLDSITGGGGTWTVDTTTRKVVESTTHYAEIGGECGHATTITASSTAVTLNLSASVSSDYSAAYEAKPASGIDSAAFCAASGTATSGSNPPSCGPETTTFSGDFIVVATIIDDGFGGGGVFTAGSGYTINQNKGGGDNDMAAENQAQSSSGSTTFNFGASGESGAWVITNEILHP